MGEKIQLDQMMNVFGGYSFLILTIVLFLCIMLVIWRLKVKQRIDGMAAGFDEEIKSLLFILFIFSLSFLSRWIGDVYLLKYLLEDADIT